LDTVDTPARADARFHFEGENLGLFLAELDRIIMDVNGMQITAYTMVGQITPFPDLTNAQHSLHALHDYLRKVSEDLKDRQHPLYIRGYHDGFQEGYATGQRSAQRN